MHEVALRILAGTATREAARTDRAAVPVLSMAEDHYVRVFLRVTEGARRADAALAQVGYAWATREGGVATGPSPPATGGPWAGPLWLGPLHDQELLDSMLGDAGGPRGNRLERSLEAWREEAGLPPLLLDVNRMAGRLKLPTPRMDGLIDALRARGHVAGRAHTNPVGVKTDATAGVVEELIRELADQA